MDKLKKLIKKLSNILLRVIYMPGYLLTGIIAMILAPISMLVRGIKSKQR